MCLIPLIEIRGNQKRDATAFSELDICVLSWSINYNFHKCQMAHNFVEGFQAWTGTLPGTANQSPSDRQEGHMIDIISQDVYLVLLWILLQTVKSFWHITFSFSKILLNKSCCSLPLYCFDKFGKPLWSILKIGKTPSSLTLGHYVTHQLQHDYLRW